MLSTSGFVPVAQEFCGQSSDGPVGQPGPLVLKPRVIESPSAAITRGGFVAAAGPASNAKLIKSADSATTVRRSSEILAILVLLGPSVPASGAQVPATRSAYASSDRGRSIGRRWEPPAGARRWCRLRSLPRRG